MVRMVWCFTRDARGATAIEYGLITAMIAVGCIVAFTAFGTGLTNLFGVVDSKTADAVGKAVAGANGN